MPFNEVFRRLPLLTSLQLKARCSALACLRRRSRIVRPQENTMISLLFCLVSVSVSPSSSFSLGPGARGGEVAAFASRGAAVVPQSRSQWAEAEPVLGLGGSSTSRGREVCVRVLALVCHGIQRAKREKGMRALCGRPGDSANIYTARWLLFSTLPLPCHCYCCVHAKPIGPVRVCCRLQGSFR